MRIILRSATTKYATRKVSGLVVVLEGVAKRNATNNLLPGF